MPIYEYRCQECGRRLEVLQRLGASGEGLSCPACGGDRLERALSTFARAAAGSGGGAGAATCAPSGAFS
jgi:putative FmdB family regulatory protein